MLSRWLCFLLLSATALTQSASSDQTAAQLIGEDEVWLMSSRRMASRNQSVNNIDAWKHVGGSWTNSTVDQFCRSDPHGVQRPVVMMIHGNSWSMSKAIQRGLETYQDAIIPWRDRPPIRFVIWTWPSDKIKGPIRNVRVKAAKADEHSFHLARFLGQLTSHPEVSIMGYSFGARVTLGALDLVGGGCVQGSRISTAPLPVPRINVSLIAPAIRNDALLTSRDKAYRQINHLFVMYNSRDQYLKYYRLARFDGQTPALGFTGVAAKSRMSNAMMRIDQFDAAEQVGAEHDYLEYIRDQEIEQRLRRNLLFQRLPH